MFLRVQLFVMSLMMWPLMVLADGPVATEFPVIIPPVVPVDPVGYDQLLGFLMQSMGGMKGASAMAIVVIVVQGLMLLLRSPLGKFAGKWKLAAVYGLSIVVGVISLKMAGVSWMAALLHSNTIAMAQVFGNQAWKQITEKPAAPSPSA